MVKGASMENWSKKKETEDDAFCCILQCCLTTVVQTFTLMTSLLRPSVMTMSYKREHTNNNYYGMLIEHQIFDDCCYTSSKVE